MGTIASVSLNFYKCLVGMQACFKGQGQGEQTTQIVVIPNAKGNLEIDRRLITTYSPLQHNQIPTLLETFVNNQSLKNTFQLAFSQLLSLCLLPLMFGTTLSVTVLSFMLSCSNRGKDQAISRLRLFLTSWDSLMSRVLAFFVRRADNFYFSILACMLGFLWTSYIQATLHEISSWRTFLSLEVAFSLSLITSYKMVKHLSGPTDCQIKAMTIVYLATAFLLVLPTLMRLVELPSILEIPTNLLRGVGQQPLPIESFILIIIIYISQVLMLIRMRLTQIKSHVLSAEIDRILPINLISDNDSSPCSATSNGSTASIADLQHFLIQTGLRIQLVVVCSQLYNRQEPVTASSSPQQMNLTAPTSTPSTSVTIQKQKLHIDTFTQANQKKIPSIIFSDCNMLAKNVKEPQLVTRKNSDEEFPSKQSFAPPSYKVIAELILKEECDRHVKLISFDEKSQTMMLASQNAAYFYSVPSFQSLKTVLFRVDSFIPHFDQLICVQYILSAKLLKFLKLDLLESRTVAAPRHQSYSFLSVDLPHEVLFFGSFASSEMDNPVDTLFIRDGSDLIAIGIEKNTIEVIHTKLPIDFSVSVKVEQLNSRSILLTIGSIENSDEIQRFSVDIPTNLTCKDLTQLPSSVDVVPVKNLSSQVILNYPNTVLNPCIYDTNNKQSLTIGGVLSISSPFFANDQLYFLDENNTLKVSDLTDVNFNLSSSNQGLPCSVSLAML